MDMRPHAGYLADELTALGFTDLGRDAEQLGSLEALMTRTYRAYGVQVEVAEDSGDVTVRLFGWGETHGNQDTYRHGHLAATTFPVTWPPSVVLAAIEAALAASVETALVAA
ncbi:hypothetical protein [Planomonospora sp. ID82291]|uniref:hypothetical protein n=1 Tax=Planomonospora sp. ID82291 TaxID=2738136 RepID=UPI0018C3FB5D|nr:hypothetical protein [Planomonospora sp. ID82291]MBG0819029.1 hypothetical protein [Planomonospora sp. ID82291]